MQPITCARMEPQADVWNLSVEPQADVCVDGVVLAVPHAQARPHPDPFTCASLFSTIMLDMMHGIGVSFIMN